MGSQSEKKVLMTKGEIKHTMSRLALEILEKNHGTENLAILGIQTRGVYLAQRLINEIVKSEHAGKNIEIPFGKVDTTLYRDDVAELQVPPPLKETDIKFDLTDKNVVLIDDVIFTGRSIRAALDVLLDFGRPKTVRLAVLVDRGHRELPIEPNFVGKKIPTAHEEEVSVELEEVDNVDQVVLQQKQ